MDISTKENDNINIAKSPSPGKVPPKRKKQRTSLDSVESDGSDKSKKNVIVFTPNSCGSKPALDFSFDEDDDELTPKLPEEVLREKRQRLTPVAVKRDNDCSDSDDDASTVCTDPYQENDGTVSLEQFQKLMDQANGPEDSGGKRGRSRPRTSLSSVKSTVSATSAYISDDNDSIFASAKKSSNKRDTASPSLLRKMLEMDSDDEEEDFDIKKATERGRKQAEMLISEVKDDLTNVPEPSSEKKKIEHVSPVFTTSSKYQQSNELPCSRARPTPLRSCLSAKKTGKKSAKKRVVFGSPKAAEFDLKDPVKGGMTPLARNVAKSRFRMDGSTFADRYNGSNQYGDEEEYGEKQEDSVTALNSSILATWEEEDEDERESSGPSSSKSSGRRSSSRRTSGIFKQNNSGLPSLTPDLGDQRSNRRQSHTENLQERFDEMADVSNGDKDNDILNRTTELDTLKSLVANETLDEDSDSCDDDPMEDDIDKTTELGTLRDLIGNSPQAETSPKGPATGASKRSSYNSGTPRSTDRKSPAKKQRDSIESIEDRTVELGNLSELVHNSRVKESGISNGEDDRTVELGNLADLAVSSPSSESQGGKSPYSAYSEKRNPNDDSLISEDRTVELGDLAELAKVNTSSLDTSSDDGSNAGNSSFRKRESIGTEDRTVDIGTLKELAESGTPKVGDDTPSGKESVPPGDRTVEIDTLNQLVDDLEEDSVGPSTPPFSNNSKKDRTVDVGTLKELFSSDSVLNSARSSIRSTRSSGSKRRRSNSGRKTLKFDCFDKGKDVENKSMDIGNLSEIPSSPIPVQPSPGLRRSKRLSARKARKESLDVKSVVDNVETIGGERPGVKQEQIPEKFDMSMNDSRLSLSSSAGNTAGDASKVKNEIPDDKRNSIDNRNSLGMNMNTLHLSFSSGSTLNTSSAQTPKPTYTSVEAGNALDNFLGVDTPDDTNKSTVISSAGQLGNADSILKRCRDRAKRLLTPISMASASPMQSSLKGSAAKFLLSHKKSSVKSSRGSQNSRLSLLSTASSINDGVPATDIDNLDNHEPAVKETNANEEKMEQGVIDMETSVEPSPKPVIDHVSSCAETKPSVVVENDALVSCTATDDIANMNMNIDETCDGRSDQSMVQCPASMETEQQEQSGPISNEDSTIGDIQTSVPKTISEAGGENDLQEINSNNEVAEGNDKKLEKTSPVSEIEVVEEKTSVCVESEGKAHPQVDYEPEISSFSADIAELQTDAQELHRIINLNIALLEQDVVLDNFKAKTSSLDNRVQMAKEDMLALKARNQLIETEESKLQVFKAEEEKLEQIFCSLQVCNSLQSWRISNLQKHNIVLKLHGSDHEIKIRIAPGVEHDSVCAIDYQHKDNQASDSDDFDEYLDNIINSVVGRQIENIINRRSLRDRIIGKPIPQIKELVTVLEFEVGRLYDVWEEVKQIGEELPIEIGVDTSPTTPALTVMVYILNDAKSFAVKCEFRVRLLEYPFSIGCCESNFTLHTCLSLPDSVNHKNAVKFVSQILPKQVNDNKLGYSLLSRQFSNAMALIQQS